MEVTKERFEKAQEAERGLWNSLDESFFVGYRHKYVEKANYLLKKLHQYGKGKNSVVLQIGSAVEDVINNLNVSEKHSIDPLADFYKKKFGKIIDYKRANYVQGVGENLPYPSEYFDVVIIANVLDHCKSPSAVLSEVKRVLKNDGILYLECHFYQPSFLILSKIYSLFKRFEGEIFNVCHPHMFSLKNLKELLSTEFIPLEEEELGKDVLKKYQSKKDLKKDLKNQKFTQRFPSYLGLLGPINYTCICTKR